MDDVDEELTAVGLAEPVWKRQAGSIAGAREGSERPPEVDASDEDIQVLRVALDARVASEGVCPADEHIELGLLKYRQRVAVELALFGHKDVFPRCSELSHEYGPEP